MGDHGVGAELLVGALQAGGQVDRVADGRVVEFGVGSEIPHHGLAGVHADAHAKVPVHLSFQFFFEIGAHLGQLGLASEGAFDAAVGVVGQFQGRVPEGHDGVALVFVDGAALLGDDVGHGRQVFVEQRGQFLRVLDLFGYGGEGFDVRKEEGQDSPVAPQLQFIRVGDELIDDRGADVVLEGVFDEPFLVAFGGVFDGESEKDGGHDGGFAKHQVEPVPLQVVEDGDGRRQQAEEKAHADDGGRVGQKRRDGHAGQGQGGARQEGLEGGDGPDEIAGKEIVQDRGVDLDAGKHAAAGGGPQIVEARRGEPHKDVFVPEGVGIGDDRGAAFHHPDLRLDHRRGAVGRVGAGGPPEPEDGPAVGIGGDGAVPHPDGPPLDLDDGAGFGGQVGTQPQGRQIAVVEPAQEGKAAIDAVRVGGELDVAEENGVSGDFGDGKGGPGEFGNRIFIDIRRRPDVHAGRRRVRGPFHSVSGLFSQKDRTGHPSAVGDGGAQRLVVSAAVEGGLGEEDVQGHRLRPLAPAVADDGAVDLPGPGP